MSLPILYSFRRCPYAMRARLALWSCDIELELREVVLKHKPQAMLDTSPKGTVPVLQLPNGDVIDESINIMHWALQQRDPNRWLSGYNQEAASLIERNDDEFKSALDRYKYADRYPEQSAETYRAEGELFLANLNQRIESHSEGDKRGYLMGEELSLADMAIFPFVRQFAHVDKPWFYATEYYFLIAWLDKLLNAELFKRIMPKYQPWQAGDTPLILNRASG